MIAASYTITSTMNRRCDDIDDLIREARMQNLGEAVVLELQQAKHHLVAAMAIAADALGE